MTAKVIRLLVFVAITGTLTLYIGGKLSNFSFQDRYKFHGTFEDVTGLRNGDRVSVAGVPVGQVTSIHLIGDGADAGRAEVTVEVNKTIKLPTATTTMNIRWRNLIGQRYIVFDPGTNGQPVTSGYYKTSGSHRIPNDKTHSAVDIGDVFNQLAPLGQAIQPAQINSIITSLSQALDGNQDNIGGLVQNLNLLSGTLADRDQTIRQMLTDYSTITDVLQKRDTQIQTMIDNLVLLSRTFSDNTALFQSTLNNVATAGSSLDRLLSANETQFRSLLDNLPGITSALSSKLPQLETAFAALPFTFSKIFDATAYGDFLRTYAVCLSPQHFVTTPPPCPAPFFGEP